VNVPYGVMATGLRNLSQIRRKYIISRLNIISQYYIIGVIGVDIGHTGEFFL
jgi:hypothetical protein